MTVAIRRLHPRARKDRKQFAAVAAEIISGVPYLSEAERADNIARYRPLYNDPGCTFVAKGDGGNIVGFCAIEQDGGALYVRWVGVLISHRGQGIATQLLQEALAHAKLIQAYKIYLDTSVSNPTMMRAAVRAGFHLDGVQWSAS